MRHYIPLQDKTTDKDSTPLLVIPLWVWLGVIACLLLFVLVLRA